ncbi:hypothetical protein Tco_1145621 [Tanacetum coccineum]
MAQAAGTQSSFNEFLATPINFFAFIMHQLKIDNLTQEVLTNPTYDLIKGTCKSVVELEYHLEEVFKATNIEDKVSRIWSPIKVVYDKHAYSGTYHWGPKHQKFYGYASNMETSKDVYSRHMIIALNNLNLEEWYALNVALRMFTRRIVIQEHVEDLQLGVESYQKKINLKNPDIYRSNPRRMTPYTTYPDIQGIIYEDEMNKNRLMRTDELHKFSDGTLNHVRTALNDIALGIKME